MEAIFGLIALAALVWFSVTLANIERRLGQAVTLLQRIDQSLDLLENLNYSLGEIWRIQYETGKPPIISPSMSPPTGSPP